MGFELTTLVAIGTDCIGNCCPKFNLYTEMNVIGV